jgi:hypothetical protein
MRPIPNGSETELFYYIIKKIAHKKDILRTISNKVR